MDNIIKGDTISWTYTYSDYSAVDYEIWVALRGTTQVDIKDGESGVTITVDGTSWKIAITAVTTAAWTTGDYTYAVYVGKSSFSERYQVESGPVTILADLATTSTTYDGRSHVKITLDAIEAVIQGRATVDQMAYSIQGRSLSKTPLEDLIKFRDVYKKEYSAEQQADRIALGLDTGNLIKVKL